MSVENTKEDSSSKIWKFEDIMRYSPYGNGKYLNWMVYKELEEDVTYGQIIPFLGAGLSVDITGIKGWKDLLRKLSVYMLDLQGTEAELFNLTGKVKWDDVLAEREFLSESGINEFQGAYEKIQEQYDKLKNSREVKALRVFIEEQKVSGEVKAYLVWCTIADLINRDGGEYAAAELLRIQSGGCENSQEELDEAFQKKLKVYFNDIVEKKPLEKQHAIYWVPFLGEHWFSLNIDGILEQAISDTNIGSIVERERRNVYGGKRFIVIIKDCKRRGSIWCLHGSCIGDSQIILSLYDYEQDYQTLFHISEAADAAEQSVCIAACEYASAETHFLFLGTSLNEKHIAKATVSREYNYAIFCDVQDYSEICKGKGGLKAKRYETEENLKVFKAFDRVIWYPKDGDNPHCCLNIILRQLVRDTHDRFWYWKKYNSLQSAAPSLKGNLAKDQEEFLDFICNASEAKESEIREFTVENSSDIFSERLDEILREQERVCRNWACFDMKNTIHSSKIEKGCLIGSDEEQIDMDPLGNSIYILRFLSEDKDYVMEICELIKKEFQHYKDLFYSPFLVAIILIPETEERVLKQAWSDSMTELLGSETQADFEINDSYAYNSNRVRSLYKSYDYSEKEIENTLKGYRKQVLEVYKKSLLAESSSRINYYMDRPRQLSLWDYTRRKVYE